MMNDNIKTSSQNYHTLEEINTRKDALLEELQQQEEKISTLWYDLFTPKKANTKGELITSIISNSITAIDAFILVRKLTGQYGHLFGLKSSKHKKR